jgi:hypothetical protein
VTGGRFVQGVEGKRIAAVAEDQGRVAGELLASSAPQGRALGQRVERGGVGREQVLQARARPALERREGIPVVARSRGAGALPRVERARGLAVVAAEEIAPYPLAQVAGDGPGVLDRQVRDAPTRVEDEGPGERLRRAHVEAPRAGAASLRHRWVLGLQIERRDDLAEHDERAEARHDEHAVLSDEAETRAGRPRALQDGLVVDERARLHRVPGGAEGSDEAREATDAPPQEPVVVVAAGVARDGPRDVAVLGVARVAARDAHDAARAREDLVSIESRSRPGIRGQPGHIALHSSLDERLVPGEVRVQRDSRTGACDRH